MPGLKAGQVVFLDSLVTKPEKHQRVELQLDQVRKDLNLELNRDLKQEAAADSHQLIVTMRSWDYRAFHRSTKIEKAIVNDTPKCINHNGICYNVKMFCHSSC